MLLKSYRLRGESEQEKGTIPISKGLSSFFREKYTDPIQATTEMEIDYLNEYFKIEIGYSSVNSARSALSSIIKPVCNVPFGKLHLACRLPKGFLISGQPCQDILQLEMLPKFLLLSSQNQLLQIVI